MSAYVYLIEEVPHEGEISGPWTKIGFSQNPPEWRMNVNLKFGNPRNIRVAKAFEYATADEARTAESNAHNQFISFKHQKEWFLVSWADVSSWMESQGAKARQKP